MNKIRFGVIGLGQRGSSVLKNVLLNIEEIEITAVCDKYQDRVDDAAKVLSEAGREAPLMTVDYKEVLASDKVDAVYVACDWEYHVSISIDALRAGKAVAMEVGGAYNIDELWELVKTWEETKTPFMFMENGCYCRGELLATNMHRHGVFGDVVHCQGSYSHDLRDEISMGNIIRHYRLRNYTHRNCENYPTHELGPIAKLLNINRGNRMLTLTAMGSKAMGLERYIKEHPELVEKDPTLEGRRFKQSDIFHTLISCANGETILLKLDTTLPRYYTRDFTVRGTKGSYFMESNSVFLDGDEHLNCVAFNRDKADSAKSFEADYQHPFWLNLTEEQEKSGHGGVDYFEFRTFVDCYLNGTEMPIDVYDAAAWMAITALSERSAAEGGMPQAIPDFTGGKWLLREPLDVVDFSGTGKGKA